MSARLEESIEHGVREGLSRDEAEQQAMVAFEQPTLLARQFGIVPGFVWVLFEKTAYAVLTYSSILGVYGRAPCPWGQVLAVLCAAWVLYQGLWDKVEVNGVRRVWRLRMDRQHSSPSDPERPGP